MITLLKRFCCWIGWHGPISMRGFDGASLRGKCKWCGYTGMLDSQWIGEMDKWQQQAEAWMQGTTEYNLYVDRTLRERLGGLDPYPISDPPGAGGE